MANGEMSKKNNEMSYYDSDFEVFHRWGSCDKCGLDIDDEIDADNTPHGGVLILDENEGDDYKQLSFDLGEEDIRNKPNNQPAHQIRTLSIPEFAADFDLCRCGGSISESSFESWGFVDRLAFNRGRFVSCSGGVFAEYGTLWGYQDGIKHEVRIEEVGLVRTISSSALMAVVIP